ncbi:MAG: tetratricopeptide repeat protein [Desulfuromusa sp.]|nr:tetratricopeptide repeat protein [Desulfuromusa sp.]
MLKIVTIVLTFLLFACVPVKQESQQDYHQADVHYKMALAHLQAENPTLALKELLIAVKQNPQNSSIQVALAQTYQRKKAYPQAETHYLKALKLSDNDPRYQNNIATLYLDIKEWDKAINYFDKASKNLLFVNAHVAMVGKGYAYFKKMDYPAALNCYNEAIQLAPRYSSAYFLKSEVYHTLGDVELEKTALQRAIELAPQFIQARYQLAVLLLQENSLEEATQQLEVILEFSPTSELGSKARKLLNSLPPS